jgi:hypothetical protein
MRTLLNQLARTCIPQGPAADREVEQEATFSGVPERRHRPRGASSLLTLEPQLLPGERLAPAEHAVAERVLSSQLRGSDRVCTDADGSFVIVLANCSGDNARVVAHRIGAEVTLRRKLGTQP